MGRFNSLGDKPDMVQVFRRFPQGLIPLCEYHDEILRGDSPLSIAERELIATYVSGTNACNFCFGAHRIYAETHGIDEDVFELLMDDPEAAGVAKKMLPILAYVKILTVNPSQVTDADAAAVYAEGWLDEALFSAIAVCALFNFMNRIVEGSGIARNDMMQSQFKERVEEGKGDPQVYSHFAQMVLSGI